MNTSTTYPGRPSSCAGGWERYRDAQGVERVRKRYCREPAHEERKVVDAGGEDEAVPRFAEYTMSGLCLSCMNAEAELRQSRAKGTANAPGAPGGPRIRPRYDPDPTRP